jgi:2-methylcitrate dehydratase PrpD
VGTSFALTTALGEAIGALTPPTTPPAAIQRALHAFIDTVGVMHAGTREMSATVLAAALPAFGPLAGNAAATANLLGTAAHALDYDDVAFGGHPSAVIVPALLATARLCGNFDGPSLLCAYVAGYETWAELAVRETTKYHARGLHPTGILGPIAAAAACANLLQLPASRAAHALALAASTCSGLVVNFGTLAKPWHAGRAAASGIEAAWLASRGMAAAGHALEAPQGFLEAYSPAGGCDTAAPMRAFGSPDFLLERQFPSVKRYPVCYAGHRCVDAALELQEKGIELGTVRRIDAHLSARNSAILRFREPATVTEARFSLEYFLGTALSTGGLRLQDLSDEALHEPVRRRLMKQVSRQIETKMDPVLEGFARSDRVVIDSGLGHPRESTPVTRPLGHNDRPLSVEQLYVKFDDCLDHAGFDITCRDACRVALEDLPHAGSCKSWVNDTVDRVLLHASR